MSRQFETNPICNDNRECFGKMYRRGGFVECRILRETYEKSGQCPFCKKEVNDVCDCSHSGRNKK